MTTDNRANYVALTREAYVQGMARRGIAIDPAWLVVAGPTEAGGAVALERWSAAARRPTAALVSNSRHIAGLYAALARRDMAPGRDLSLIAILPEAPTVGFAPALATYQTDWETIGVRLGEALLGSIAGAGAAGAPIQEIAPVAYRHDESVARR